MLSGVWSTVSSSFFAFDSFNEITIGIDMEEDWTESLYKGTQSHSLSGGDILLGRELYV